MAGRSRSTELSREFSRCPAGEEEVEVGEGEE